MAGDIKRQRKSWTQQDRSKVSINILRANLAEEGDEDAQLDVAKRLLEENAGPGVTQRTRNENIRLALYWLIKSSEQGNDEATHLLKECLQSGKGLTAQNILDVQSCVNTPKDEKLTFKAARLLHRKLSNGEEFITTTQLLARANMRRKSVAFEENSNGMANSVLFPEEDRVENSKEIRGRTEKEGNSSDTPSTPQLGLGDRSSSMNLTFTVSNPNSPSPFSSPSSGDESPNKSFQNSFSKTNPQNGSSAYPEQHPDLQLAMMQSGKKLTLSDLVNVAKDFNLGSPLQVFIDERNRILDRHVWHANSFLSTFTLQILILAVVGNVMPLSDALTFLMYSGVFWSAYNLLTWKLRHRNFNDWKLAFSSVLQGEPWDGDKFKIHLAKKYLLLHLINILCGLLLLPFATGGQFTHFVVAAGVTVMGSIQLGVFQRILLGWRQLLLSSMALIYYHSSSITHILNDNLTEQIKSCHESLAVYFPPYVNTFTVITCLILFTSLKFSLKGILEETLPHIVVSLCLIKVAQTGEKLEISQFGLSILAGFAILVLMSLLCSKLEMWKVILIILSLTTVTIATGFLITKNINSNLIGENEPSLLYWEDYETSCHRKAWTVQSPASTQLKCSSLFSSGGNNVVVKWKGRIRVVQVEKVSRSLFTAPGTSWDDVVFDISVGIFSTQNNDDGSRNWQSFLSSSDTAETLAPASILVSTGGIGDKKKKENLVDHILNLRSGDKIEFVGKLDESTIGSLKPLIVDVRSLQCLSCAVADYGEFMVGESKDKYDLEWIAKAWSSQQEEINDTHFLTEYKQTVINLLARLHDSVMALLKKEE